MNTFKLPGSLKVKKIILAVLVIIAAAVVVQYAVENKKGDVKEDTVKEEQITASEDNTNSEAAETKEPTEEDNLYSDAYNTFFQGNYEEAVKKADIVISKYPQSFKGYTIRGIAKAFKGSYQDGMTDIDKALEINPDFAYARYNKALNYELYGHYDEALAWYDKALEVEHYMWSYYGIASIYGRRGDVENTVKYLNEAVKAENSQDGKSGIKEEAKTEKDFDPVRNSTQFQNFINN